MRNINGSNLSPMFLNKKWPLALLCALFFTSAWFSTGQAHAADDSITPLLVVVQLVGDNDGNNIANIGDVIQIQVLLQNTDGDCLTANTQVTMDFQAYGLGANEPLTCVAPGANDLFQVDAQIFPAGGAGIDVGANNAASQIQVFMTDADENAAGAPNPVQQQTNALGDGAFDTAATNGVDTIEATITDGNILSIISVDGGDPGIAEESDIIRTTWDNSAGGDNNADNIVTTTVDLTEFGGGSNQQMFDDGSNGDQVNGDGIFTFDLTITTGTINDNNLNALVTVQDDANNFVEVGDSSNITVNNVSDGRRRRDRTYDTECSCDAERLELDSASGVLFNDYLNNPDAWMCVNPVCIDIDVDLGGSTQSETEKIFRDAVKTKLDLVQPMQDASTEYTNATKAFDDALGNRDGLHAEYNIQEGETDFNDQSSIDKLRVTARAAKKAQDDLDAARIRLIPAQENYHQLTADMNQAMKEEDDAYNALIEEEGEEKAKDIFREAYDMKKPEQSPQEPTFEGCFDSSCGNQFIDIQVNLPAFDSALENYNECALQCELPPATFAPSSGLVIPPILKFPTVLDIPDSLLDTNLPSDFFGHPADFYIFQLYGLGVLNPDVEAFDADRTLNRAELFKMVLLIFNVTVDESLLEKVFDDVDPNAWFGPWFAIGNQLGFLTGYPDGTARPGQDVTWIEALVLTLRSGGANLDNAMNYPLPNINFDPNVWFTPYLKYGLMNGLIFSNTPDGSVSWQRLDEKITRSETAVMITESMTAIEQEKLWDCDKDKKAWEDAKKETEDAEADAEKQEAEADAAEQAAKDADQKVQDLQKFFDDSSYVSDEDGTVTLGDIELLKEVNRGIQAAWLAGELTAQEASDAWGEADRDQLEALRAKKKAELEQAEKDAKAADDKAKKERAEAEAARKKSDDSKIKEDEAKKAYDECLKECGVIADAAAAERKAEKERQEAEAAAIKAAAEAAAAAQKKAEEEAAAAVERAEATAAAEKRAQEKEEIRAAAKEADCKQAFIDALVARGKQIKKRGGEVPDPPKSLKTGIDITVAIGDAIAAASQAAATGSTTAGSIASGLTSVLNLAYGLWVNYVGNIALEAGKQLVATRHCGLAKYEAAIGKGSKRCCGVIESKGQVTFYQKDKDGNMVVIIMGPGDSVISRKCK